MNIPEGYILVPIIPTEEMIGEGQNQEWTEDVYAAMIGAAPFVCESSVEEYDESKERELFDAWYEEYVSYGWSVSKIGTWESWKSCAKSRVRSA